jgi:hypothetical protein
MRYGKSLGLVGVLLASATLTLRADVWDVGTATDDVATQTHNSLIHGSEQVHDLAAKAGVTDQDWFILTEDAYSSYIVLVDGLTADVGLFDGGITRRSYADPNTNLQFADTVQAGSWSAQLTWQNTGPQQLSFLRISPGGGPFGGCTTTCDANDQYRVRLLDTTFSVPRFNNANGQVTVLLVQNTLSGTAVSPNVNWTGYYWNVAGTQLAAVPGTLAARQTAVINLSTIPALQNQTGAITVSHTAGYGGLAVKSVALEPATGFSFDTPGTYRSR